MEVFKNHVIGLDYKATKVLGFKKNLINFSNSIITTYMLQVRVGFF
jgi:hypothetical protein